MSVFSKSVLRYCKVLFYPPNIDIVLFYRKYTDIDIDDQYQEIYTDKVVLSVFFSIIMYIFAIASFWDGISVGKLLKTKFFWIPVSRVS